MPREIKPPPRIKVSTGRYNATVLHVLERDVFGRPTMCRVLHDDETIKLEGGEEFAIVYMHDSQTKKGVAN